MAVSPAQHKKTFHHTGVASVISTCEIAFATASAIRDDTISVFSPVNLDVFLNRTDVQALNSRRGWIVDQLAALIRNGAIPKDDLWIQTVLDWFVVHGLFAIKRKSDKSSFLAVRISLWALYIPSFAFFISMFFYRTGDVQANPASVFICIVSPLPFYLHYVTTSVVIRRSSSVTDTVL